MMLVLSKSSPGCCMSKDYYVIPQGVSLKGMQHLCHAGCSIIVVCHKSDGLQLYHF